MMKNTRRSFLQSLAAIPLLGRRAFAQPTSTAGMDAAASGADFSVVQLMPEPVYGFTENKMLGQLFGNQVFVYGEKVKRGDFVTFGKDGCTVVLASVDDHPVGMATAPANAGDEAQDSVLVQGQMTPKWTVWVSPKNAHEQVESLAKA